MDINDQEAVRARLAAVRDRHPGLREAVVADAQATLAFRGERHEFRSGLDTVRQILRLALITDAFLGQVFYRLKARLEAARVPLLPSIAHRAAMMVAQISIGSPVVVEPGLYVLHGQVVIDGFVEVGRGTVVAPFVTVGLRSPEAIGPTIGPGVQIGTKASVLGPVTIGAGATIGANSVVLDDVAPRSTVVGSPARPVAGPN